MSKSKGNVVDPVCAVPSATAWMRIRFFLLRSFPFGSDGNFSQ